MIGQAVRENISLNPSVTVLAGLIAGIIIFYGDGGAGALGWLVPAAIIVSLFLLGLPKESAKFAISLGAGLACCWNPGKIDPENYYSLVGPGDCAAEIEIRVSDLTSTGSDIDWLPAPRPMSAEVLRLRFSDNGKWHDSIGSIALFLPRGTPPPQYGASFRAKGAFLEPDSGLFQGDFDYRGYLLSKGIRKIYRVREIRPVEGDGGSPVMGSLVSARNYMLLKVCEGVGDDANKSVLAAIISGVKQGIDAETRQRYFLSGMIHVLVVSGLQVGMLALTLFWLFRWVPFSSRYLLVTALLFLYALSTDFQPSVLRAFLMIGVWCVFRAFFIPILPLNSIFLAASAMLLINPLSLFDRGFQFSFTVTAFLVLAWSYTRELCELILEKYSLAPRGAKDWRRTAISWSVWNLIPAGSTTLFAWLASTPISLFYQGLMVSASLPANFAAIPLAWLIFVASILKFILYPFLHWPADFLIRSSLEMLDLVSRLAAERGFDRHSVAPPAIEILLFYGFLVVLFASRRWKFVLPASLAVASMLFIWGGREYCGRPKAAVFYGGESSVPCIVLKPDSGRNSFIVNPSSFSAAKSALNWLSREGVCEIKYLLISSSAKEFCSGSGVVFSGMDVGEIILPATWRRSPYARKAAADATSSGVAVGVMCKDGRGGMALLSQRGAFSVEKSSEMRAEASGFTVSMRKLSGGGFDIEISSAGSETERLRLLPQNRTEMTEIVF